MIIRNLDHDDLKYTLDFRSVFFFYRKLHILRTSYKYPFGRYSPAYRLKRRTCEMCEATNIMITMHHVRKLSELESDTPWHALMPLRLMKWVYKI